MLRCIAVSGSQEVLSQLTESIANIPFLNLTGSFMSLSKVRDLLATGQVDAVFMDIDSQDVDCVQFYDSLPMAPLTVVVTANPARAMDAFRLGAVYCIAIPCSQASFRMAAEALLRQWNLVYAKGLEMEDETIFLKIGHRYQRLGIPSICYVEGMSEYLKIWIDGRKEPVIVLLSLRKLEDRLPSESFMRVHRSYIVNLKKIESVTKNLVIMENSVSLPIGDLYKDSLNGYIDSKYLGK